MFLKIDWIIIGLIKMLISREPEVEVILLVKLHAIIFTLVCYLRYGHIEAFGLRPSHPLCYAMLCYAINYITYLLTNALSIFFIFWKTTSPGDSGLSANYLWRFSPWIQVSRRDVSPASVTWQPVPICAALSGNFYREDEMRQAV